MVSKAVFVICASVVLVQTISGQCIGNGIDVAVADNYGLAGWAGNGAGWGGSCAGWAGNGAGWAGNGAGWAGNCGGWAGNVAGYGAGYGWAGNGCGVAAPIATGNGGGLSVISSSPINPNGITVRSENGIDGALAVSGELPVLSAVTFEGQLPTAGASGVSYGCGNGNIGIVSEGIAGAGLAGAAGYGAGLAGGCGYGVPLVKAGFPGAPIGDGFVGIGGCGGIYY